MFIGSRHSHAPIKGEWPGQMRFKMAGKFKTKQARPVARGGSGGSIEPPIAGSVYCAVQSVHSMPHGFGRRQSSLIHNIEQCNAAGRTASAQARAAQRKGGRV